jgi:multiple sugar transport system substrate-binding protein
MTELRGLCWDHPRCTAPMTAAARVWSAQRAAIRWDSRPLAAFNDQPIAETVAGYDLVFVDHPAIAEAAGAGCLLPLDELVEPGTLRSLAADAIAGSHDSYTYAGHQWAVAVDAACQVAAVDPARYTDQPPRTWQEVLRLATKVPGLVGLPLYPSDAIISLISITGGAPDELIGQTAVEVLVELAAQVDPRCFDLNPPGLLDVMASAETAGPAYVPLLFGYTDYQRPTRRHPIRFSDAPTMDGQPGGTVLGGAGLAVPAGIPGTPRRSRRGLPVPARNATSCACTAGSRSAVRFGPTPPPTNWSGGSSAGPAPPCGRRGPDRGRRGGPGSRRPPDSSSSRCCGTASNRDASTPSSPARSISTATRSPRHE